MRTMPLTDGLGRIPELCEDVVREHDRVVLTRPEGNVVLVAEEDWDNMIETLRVVQDKVAMRALLEAHAARDAGRPLPGKSIEEVFSDVVGEDSQSG